MYRKGISIYDDHGLKQIANNYLSVKPPLPKCLILSDILREKNIDDWMIHSEKEKITKWINTISLLRWLCQDLARVLRAFCNSAISFKFAIFIFRSLEVNLFDQIIRSQSMRLLYQKQQRIKSRPYKMRFQQASSLEENINLQIDQNLPNNQQFSILYQQRQKSNKAAIESFGNIQGDCFEFVSINSQKIARDIMQNIIRNKSINFISMGKGLKIIASNLALNLRRKLRKEKFLMVTYCEECRSKIQFRLYLLSALILPHSSEGIQQYNSRNPTKRSPLLYFNQPSGIVHLHSFLLEVDSIQLNDQKGSLSDLISRKDK